MGLLLAEGTLLFSAHFLEWRQSEGRAATAISEMLSARRNACEKLSHTDVSIIFGGDAIMDAPKELHPHTGPLVFPAKRPHSMTERSQFLAFLGAVELKLVNTWPCSVDVIGDELAAWIWRRKRAVVRTQVDYVATSLHIQGESWPLKLKKVCLHGVTTGRFLRH